MSWHGSTDRKAHEYTWTTIPPWPLLAPLLHNAGHDVALPADIGMRGQDDPVQLAWAVEQDRILLTHDHDDFRNLHNLIMKVGGTALNSVSVYDIIRFEIGESHAGNMDRMRPCQASTGERPP
jgi:hypothetical protein